MVYKTLSALSMIFLAFLLLFQCVAAEKKIETPSQKSVSKQLLFFMNPRGRPCQMQDVILTKMGESLTSKASLVYYKTTNRQDHTQFRKYGIRGLPMLIVADSSGKVLKRFTPGVQDDRKILDGLAEN